MAKQKQQAWRNRITGHGEKPASWFLANEKNWRVHPRNQQEGMKGALDSIGWVQDVIVNVRTSEEWGADQGVQTLVDGHLRVTLALREGDNTPIPVKYVDLTPTEEAQVLATLDPLAAMAATDKAKLDELMHSIQSDDERVQAMLSDLAEREGLEYGKQEPADDPGAQVDRAEELLGKWPVSLGDIFVCGDHRILCGDSTNAESIARLMQGEKAVCMWTDPPYGVEYVGKTKDALTIENDGAEDLPGLLSAAFAIANDVLEPGAPFYVAHPPGALQLVFLNSIASIGWKIHEQLVWVKDSMVLGHADYHYKHEPIIYGWTQGAGRSGRGDHEGSRWYGDNSQVSVFEIARPKRSELHPTMKPPELVQACLQNSTKRGDVVYEPFSGSGTTLIACEATGRKCRAAELTPKFIAVTLERWSTMTGKTPELIEGGV